MKLYNLAEGLILELVNKNSINKIMDKKRLASVKYDDGEDPGGKNKRWIEIYGYGISTAGNDIIRVYQIGGDTKTIQPGWKTFRTDRMKELEMLGGTFDTPRPLFNPNGDKNMKQIFKILKFDKNE